MWSEVLIKTCVFKGLTRNHGATQVAINDVARTIAGKTRNDHILTRDLLLLAGLPSLNEVAVRATIVETWKAFHSSDGRNGTRNPIGEIIFSSSSDDSIDSRITTRSKSAGIILTPMHKTIDTFAVHASTVWNKSQHSLGFFDFLKFAKQAFAFKFYDRAIEFLKVALKLQEQVRLSEKELKELQKLKKHLVLLNNQNLYQSGQTIHGDFKILPYIITDNLKRKKNQPDFVKDGNILSSSPVNRFERDARFRKVCNGNLDRNGNSQIPHQCHWLHHDDPFLKLGPFKMEMASRSPFIVVFHDFLAETEIQFLVDYSRPRLSPLNTTSKYATTEYQTTNYGLGGLCETHYDPHGYIEGVELPPHPKFKRYLKWGDMMATTMAWLEEVEAGGATGFASPGHEVLVWPRKGSVAFWFDLDRKGHRDTRLLHGGCPIIKGSKWILNKWIHYYDQFPKYRCSLDPTDFIEAFTGVY
eukprot:maker-scaffold359_size197282-snap-gene-0.21 protein:Tk01284 transcript:maker-scaffold359_size197282-snap-gene-0.21-mRNA-1 annotation:"hypothetical protein DAPPUDRAFT_308081"